MEGETCRNVLLVAGTFCIQPGRPVLQKQNPFTVHIFVSFFLLACFFCFFTFSTFLLLLFSRVSALVAEMKVLEALFAKSEAEEKAPEAPAAKKAKLGPGEAPKSARRSARIRS